MPHPVDDFELDRTAAVDHSCGQPNRIVPPRLVATGEQQHRRKIVQLFEYRATAGDRRVTPSLGRQIAIAPAPAW